MARNLPLHYKRFRYMPCRYLMADQVPIPPEADLIIFSGVVFTGDYAECYHAPEDCRGPQSSAPLRMVWLSQGTSSPAILHRELVLRFVCVCVNGIQREGRCAGRHAPGERDTLCN